MKIVLVQSDIIWGNPEANIQKNDAVLERHKGVDLVIFPEMFSTGFITEPEGFAEEEPSGTLTWMRESAAKYGFAIAGSISLKKNGTFYNRFYFVKPDGEVNFYDKRHLFTYGAEHDYYTPGNERKIVEWKGFRFLLTVCYDLRFPVWIKNKQDYDAIICVANWPVPRRMNWDILLRARAIENQCYALGVNRVGSDPVSEYNGGTAAIHFFGDTMSACEDSSECECEADLDINLLKSHWDHFPALKDADKFEIR